MEKGEMQKTKRTGGADYQITSWCRRMMRDHVSEGSHCIDATMGNGYDTEYLCTLVGKEGFVWAFDIQKRALEATRGRLKQALSYTNYELLLASHSRMSEYVEPETIDCITFNLGYLPGGDHTIATRAETTIEALKQGLQLLKKNGLISICIYSGGDSGFEERDRVLAWLKELDSRKYLVLVTEYYNRPHHPPIPVMIIKL